MANESSRIGSVPGYVREATIKVVDLTKGTIQVVLNLGKNDTGEQQNVVEIPIPLAWSGPNGEFSGGCPVAGATVWVALGQGGRWAALQYAPNTDNVAKGTISANLKPGRWTTRTSSGIQLFVDKNLGILGGTQNENLQIDPQTNIAKRSIISYRFKQALEFTEAVRKIDGPVKRDLSANANRNITGSALDSHVYDDSLTTIGLDPLTKPGTSFNRNPAYNEVREEVYEFAWSYGYTNDAEEASRYDSQSGNPSIPAYFPRRDSRADTLSLALSSPNYLMETVKGTLVDIYGNLLDINRNRLPSGSIDSLSLRSATTDRSETFIKLLEQDRKTIAFHAEINARKAKVPDANSILPPAGELTPVPPSPGLQPALVAGTGNYARDRSRGFIDVDKEGQFKINIPSSSEVGNISLMTRYENYSTLLAAQNNTNPNEFVRNVNNQDIFIEGFGVGVIGLSEGDQTLDGYASPVDRVTGVPIKLGTTYHNLSLAGEFHNIPNPIGFDSESKVNDPLQVPLLGNVVSPNITVSGPNANAGGRSGTISLDGMLSVSLGANTIDRQSLWFDCAGGIVQMIGRDINNNSVITRADGNVMVEIGGPTITNDNRFKNLNNAKINGVLDIRIFNNNQFHVFRFDGFGLTVATPGQMNFESGQTMRFKSLSDIILDGENITFYASSATPRLVLRKPGQTI